MTDGISSEDSRCENLPIPFFHSRSFRMKGCLRRIGSALAFAIGLAVACCGCADHSIVAAPWLDQRPGAGRNQFLVGQAITFEIIAKHELRGDPPPMHFPTWRAYWHSEYQRARDNSGSPEEAEAVTECAHFVLQRLGLPTYDP